MHTKSIIAGAAIALVASLGSASAHVHWTLSPPGIGGMLDPSSADAAGPVGDAGCAGCGEGVFRVGDPFGSAAGLAPGAKGLLNAEETGKTPINVCTEAAGGC